MAGLLISGPAGAGKTALAREALQGSGIPAVLLDLQSLYATILGIERLTNGRYPERLESDAHGLRLAEFIRRAALDAAQRSELFVIFTNSDGDAARRAELLEALGDGAMEQIVDPGREVVEARLSRPDGTLSSQCADAISRWYDRAEFRESELAVVDVPLELRSDGSELHGVLIAEGRASSGGRSELFAPGSVEWFPDGVAILPEHRGAVETRVIPERQSDGSITFSAKLTDGMRRAWEAGRRWMSVEFRALSERTVKGGIREVQRALVVNGAMVSNPEYDVATTEIRSESFTVKDLENESWRLL